jgi:type I restriction enzyme M protein
LINRRTKELSQEDVEKITSTYHNWRNLEGNYEDIAGFCAAAPISKVKELDYVLTPGRYVGLPDDEDDFDFAERFASLKAELEKQIAEEDTLNKIIMNNLKKIEQ